MPPAVPPLDDFWVDPDSLTIGSTSPPLHGLPPALMEFLDPSVVGGPAPSPAASKPRAAVPPRSPAKSRERAPRDLAPVAPAPALPVPFAPPPVPLVSLADAVARVYRAVPSSTRPEVHTLRWGDIDFGSRSATLFLQGQVVGLSPEVCEGLQVLALRAGHPWPVPPSAGLGFVLTLTPGSPTSGPMPAKVVRALASLEEFPPTERVETALRLAVAADPREGRRVSLLVGYLLDPEGPGGKKLQRLAPEGVDEESIRPRGRPVANVTSRGGYGTHLPAFQRTIAQGQMFWTPTSEALPGSPVRKATQRFVSPAYSRHYTSRARAAIAAFESFDLDSEQFGTWLDHKSNRGARFGWILFCAWMAQQGLTVPRVVYGTLRKVEERLPEHLARQEAERVAEANQKAQTDREIVAALASDGRAAPEGVTRAKLAWPLLSDRGNTTPRYTIIHLMEGGYLPVGVEPKKSDQRPAPVANRSEVVREIRARLHWKPTPGSIEAYQDCGAWQPLLVLFEEWLVQVEGVAPSTARAYGTHAGITARVSTPERNHPLPFLFSLRGQPLGGTGRERGAWVRFREFLEEMNQEEHLGPKVSLRAPRPHGIDPFDAMPAAVVQAIGALVNWRPERWTVSRLRRLTAWHVYRPKEEGADWVLISPTNDAMGTPREDGGYNVSKGTRIQPEDRWIFETLLAWRHPPQPLFNPGVMISDWPFPPLRHTDPLLVPYPGVGITLSLSWLRSFVRETPSTDAYQLPKYARRAEMRRKRRQAGAGETG